MRTAFVVVVSFHLNPSPTENIQARSGERSDIHRYAGVGTLLVFVSPVGCLSRILFIENPRLFAHVQTNVPREEFESFFFVSCRSTCMEVKRGPFPPSLAVSPSIIPRR